MLTIIDYGIGNLTSVKNMLKKVGCRDVKISGLKEDIINADKLILPGVGHFDHCMDMFERSVETLVVENKTGFFRKPLFKKGHNKILFKISNKKQIRATS